MSDDAYQQIRHEVKLFRQWAAGHPDVHGYGEWECLYDRWTEIYTAFDRFISRVPFKDWSQKTVSDILYIIARNNEDEQLIDDLAKDPERLLCVARASLGTAEYDAKWQVADRLGDLTERAAEAEDILSQFISGGQNEFDPNEYTSRRALMALGRLKSPTVEVLAEGAWATGYQHQRISVLRALYDVGSPQLEKYLRLAEADNSQYLPPYAARIRAGRPE